MTLLLPHTQGSLTWSWRGFLRAISTSYLASISRGSAHTATVINIFCIIFGPCFLRHKKSNIQAEEPANIIPTLSSWVSARSSTSPPGDPRTPTSMCCRTSISQVLAARRCSRRHATLDAVSTLRIPCGGRCHWLPKYARIFLQTAYLGCV